jgi:hypothetical protein
VTVVTATPGLGVEATVANGGGTSARTEPGPTFPHSPHRGFLHGGRASMTSLLIRPLPRLPGLLIPPRLPRVLIAPGLLIPPGRQHPDHRIPTIPTTCFVSDGRTGRP